MVGTGLEVAVAIGVTVDVGVLASGVPVTVAVGVLASGVPVTVAMGVCVAVGAGCEPPAPPQPATPAIKTQKALATRILPAETEPRWPPLVSVV
jgi:hypothetical protein